MKSHFIHEISKNRREWREEEKEEKKKRKRREKEEEKSTNGGKEETEGCGNKQKGTEKGGHGKRREEGRVQRVKKIEEELKEETEDEPISPGKNVNFWLNEMGVRQEATQEGTERKKEWSGKEK